MQWRWTCQYFIFCQRCTSVRILTWRLDGNVPGLGEIAPVPSFAYRAAYGGTHPGFCQTRAETARSPDGARFPLGSRLSQQEEMYPLVLRTEGHFYRGGGRGYYKPYAKFNKSKPADLELLSIVALMCDVPKGGLLRGQLGLVVRFPKRRLDRPAPAHPHYFGAAGGGGTTGV
jgi:hypothetical protein